MASPLSFITVLFPLEKMAVAIASSAAKKILVPITKCNQIVVGVDDKPLSEYIKLVYQEVKRELADS